MRHDDDLVDGEETERVVDRLQRVGVADIATCLNARTTQGIEAALEPPFCRQPRGAIVGQPEAQATSQGGGCPVVRRT